MLKEIDRFKYKGNFKELIRFLLSHNEYHNFLQKLTTSSLCRSIYVAHDYISNAFLWDENKWCMLDMQWHTKLIVMKSKKKY